LSWKKGISRFSVVGIIDNYNPFDLRETSKPNPASALWCTVSSLSWVTGAFNIGWGCEHQKLISASKCIKLSTFLVALSSPIAGGTCGLWLSSN
jgi:hypothetical protein